MVQGGQFGEESSEESGCKTCREEARRQESREETRRQESREEARCQACNREASRSQEGREASCGQACCPEACRREARGPARRPRPTANRVGRFKGVSTDDYHAPRELAGRDTTTGRHLERVVPHVVDPQNRASLDAKIPPGNPLQVTDSCPTTPAPTGTQDRRRVAAALSRRRQANLNRHMIKRTR